MKNENTFAPVKIGYSESGATSKIYQINNQANNLNKFRLRFENLGLLWNINTLNDMFCGGIESENTMVRNIQQEVSRISIPGLRDKMQKELDETVMLDFKQLRIEVKESKPDCNPMYLKMEGGAVRLTDEGKKAIEDSFIVWASTLEELKIWEEATDLVKRLAELDEKLKPFGIYAIARSDINEPSVIRMGFRNADVDVFTIKECKPTGLWAGRR
ncbi:hypothetical protein [Massilibacteroides sp.]|uniref:hypothetical protein n=1 Tax=Massilibacteroides sp. TaxID=2034766 RepID=UPI00260E1220|nr:hypothetical protein [Massilibacteroides sp.]MDD4515728.1 hypothetical protein [Massilibacteroides sp.]